MASQGEKRSHSDSVDVLEGVKAVLLDVEGTASPLSFVKDKLFPYVQDNLKTYLEGHFDNEDCQKDVSTLRKQASEDVEAKVEGAVAIPESADDNKDAVVEAVVANVMAQMSSDRQTASLKAFQGHLFREAYKTGAVQGEIYDDVAAAVKSLSASGVKVYTFSSTKADNQKLLFSYSEKGELSEFIAGHYDSECGSKTEKDSYSKIASESGVSAGEMLFLTDLAAEASAAAEAGFKTSLVERKDNAALSEEDKAKFNTLKSLQDLVSDAAPAAKRPAEEANNGSSAAADEEEADSAEGEEEGEEEGEDDEEGEDAADNGDS